MERTTYAPALPATADPTMIDDKDAEIYLGYLFTDHWVKSSGDQKIKDFQESAPRCLKIVTTRRRSLRITLILLGIALGLVSWGFAKDNDFPADLVIVFIGILFGVVGVLWLRGFLEEEKPGQVVYDIAAAWKEAAPKLHDVDVIRQFGCTLRGQGLFRRVLYYVRNDVTDLAGRAFEARLRHYRDELRKAETVRHKKNAAKARNMFAKTDKASQSCGFKGADWKMLSE